MAQSRLLAKIGLKTDIRLKNWMFTKNGPKIDNINDKYNASK
jgi:hypothetical protein